MITSQISIEKALGIGGWMSESELIWLASKASENNIIVEIGSYHGRSTRALGDNTSGFVIAVDPWNGDYFTEDGRMVRDVNTFAFPFFKKNLIDLIQSSKVIPVRMYSSSFNLPFKVDMIFIDGDHNIKGMQTDLMLAEKIVRKGGIISGHDYGHPLWEYVKLIVDEKYGAQNIKTEGSIWWITKS